MEYRRGAHTVFEIHLHLVWITKYRRPIADGRDRNTRAGSDPGHHGRHEVSIMKGHVSKDHVHLTDLCSPPQVTINRLLQWLKKAEQRTICWRSFPHLKRQFWGDTHTCGRADTFAAVQVT